MQRSRRKRAGPVDYKLIDSGISDDKRPEQTQTKDSNLHAYLISLAKSDTCRHLSEQSHDLPDERSIDNALLDPLLVKRGSNIKHASVLRASHPTTEDIFLALDGGTVEVQVASSSASDTTTAALSQWQHHLKSMASSVPSEGPRPLKRLRRIGDMVDTEQPKDTGLLSSAAATAAQLPGIFSSHAPLYATTDVSLLAGFAVPAAVVKRSAVPKGSTAAGAASLLTMEAVSASPAASADFHAHFAGAATWWQQLSGQCLVVAAPPSTLNLAAWLSTRDGETWNGTLGHQLRGLVAAELGAGDVLLLPAGWLVAHTALTSCSTRSTSSASSSHSTFCNTALRGSWQPLHSLAPQLTAWQAMGGVKNTSAQSLAFGDLLWRTVVVVRAHLKAVARLPAAELMDRADHIAQQRANIAAIASATMASNQARPEQAAAVRRSEERNTAVAPQLVVSPVPRHKRRKAQRPKSAAAPSDALPLSLQPSIPTYGSAATKLKIRVGGAVMSTRPKRKQLTRLRDRAQQLRRAADSSDDGSMGTSKETTWRDLRNHSREGDHSRGADCREQEAGGSAASLPRQQLLRHQVRTRGGRVASRAVVTFDDTHPVGSSSGGSSPAPSLDASEDYAPQDDVKEASHHESSGDSGNLARPRVTLRLNYQTNTIPQVDGAGDSDEEEGGVPPSRPPLTPSSSLPTTAATPHPLVPQPSAPTDKATTGSTPSDLELAKAVVGGRSEGAPDAPPYPLAHLSQSSAEIVAVSEKNPVADTNCSVIKDAPDASPGPLALMSQSTAEISAASVQPHQSALDTDCGVMLPASGLPSNTTGLAPQSNDHPSLADESPRWSSQQGEQKGRLPPVQPVNSSSADDVAADDIGVSAILYGQTSPVPGPQQPHQQQVVGWSPSAQLLRGASRANDASSELPSCPGAACVISGRLPHVPPPMPPSSSTASLQQDAGKKAATEQPPLAHLPPPASFLETKAAAAVQMRAAQMKAAQMTPPAVIRSHAPAVVAPLPLPLPLPAPHLVIPGTSMHKTAVEGIEIVAVKKKRPVLSKFRPPAPKVKQTVQVPNSQTATAPLTIAHWKRTLDSETAAIQSEGSIHAQADGQGQVDGQGQADSEGQASASYTMNEQNSLMPSAPLLQSGGSVAVELIMGRTPVVSGPAHIASHPHRGEVAAAPLKASAQDEHLDTELPRPPSTEQASMQQEQHSEGTASPLPAVKPSLSGDVFGEADRGGTPRHALAITQPHAGLGFRPDALQPVERLVSPSPEAMQPEQRFAAADAVRQDHIGAAAVRQEDVGAHKIGGHAARGDRGGGGNENGDPDDQEPDDTSRWQGGKPSWLPPAAFSYEDDPRGLGALFSAVQELGATGHTAPSFILDTQRLVDELAVCMAAACVVLPESAPRSSALASHRLQMMQLASGRSRGAPAAHGDDDDYAAPPQGDQADFSSSGDSGSDSSAGGGGSTDRVARGRGDTEASRGRGVRRLKRPHSGVLSPVGDEEAADSVIEARARGGMVSGRHAGLPGLAGLTAKKPSVKARLMKKLRLL